MNIFILFIQYYYHIFIAKYYLDQGFNFDVIELMSSALPLLHWPQSILWPDRVRGMGTLDHLLNGSDRLVTVCHWVRLPHRGLSIRLIRSPGRIRVLPCSISPLLAFDHSLLTTALTT